MHNDRVFLSSEQIDKLKRVLNPIIPIYPSPSNSAFPTVHIVPIDFLRKVLTKLREHSIEISSVRLNGGAASYVLIKDSNFAYRDIDILFCVDTPLASELETTLFSSNNQPYPCEVWTIIKYVICSCLIEHMPEYQTSTPSFLSSVLDTYTKKNIHITYEQDSWALLSLQNLLGRNLELKFIERWKRQWQFSVDSFQIDLEQLIFEPSNCTTQSTKQRIPMSDISVNPSTIRTDTDRRMESHTTSLQLGFFTPSSSPTVVNTQKTNQCQTLTTMTTFDALSNMTNRSRSHSKNASSSNDGDEPTVVDVQFSSSTNEDSDDGIVVDTDESTVDDDDPAFRTPPMETIAMSQPLQIEYTSVYKNREEALYHLNEKFIATYEPEKLRGGGLLKYCDLLAQGYKVFDVSGIIQLQKYMCSRFFIDFKTSQEQISMIVKYVASHFLPSSRVSEFYERQNWCTIPYNLPVEQSQPKTVNPTDLINARLCLLFFRYLINVIQDSCVCLSGVDRDYLLMSIETLFSHYHAEYEYILITDDDHLRRYHSSPQYYNVQRSPMPTKSNGYNRWNPHRQGYMGRQNYAGNQYYGNQTNYSSNHRRKV